MVLGAKLQPILILTAAILGLLLGNFTTLGQISAGWIELFLMLLLYILFLTVDLRQLKQAFQNVKYTTAAVMINFVITPVMETAYTHIKSQTVAGKDVDALAMEIVNYGGFFRKHPHYTYIFLNMLNGKPDHLSKELEAYCRDFKEKNRSCFADFIQSLDLGRGVTKCDVENFLSLMQNVGAPTISSFVSENPDDTQRAIMARLIRIFLQGLQSDIT